MPQAAKETVDVTSLIKGIINGYPGSSAIFREYLQNSDDAKANKQTFLLDEKSYPTTTLVDPILQDSQGPALIAMNDQILSPCDWTALKNIHASSKTTDESQTGKNGLGFRASYHLTENPQILSGGTLMVLDPHNQFKAFPGGMSIDIINEGPAYQDQLAPFIPIMKDPYKYYHGTIFRLPLRTKSQATRSRIKNEATAASEIKQLLESFGQNELEEAILFLKNISTIEIRHISSSGEEYFIGRATIDQRGASTLFTRQVNCEAPAGISRSRTWRFSTYQADKSTAAQIVSKKVGYDIGDELINEKLVANVELALPLGGPSIQGRLFTLLPLPVKTGFPLHMNAVFALTPDRQNLKNIEEAGLPRERRLVEWNRAIFEDFGSIAWVNILSGLTAPSEFWAAWPPEEHDKNSFWAKLIPSIIRIATTSNLPIFPLVSSDGSSSYTALNNDSVLLAPPHPKVSLALLGRLRLMVVQVPPHILAILTSGTVQVSASILSPMAVHQVLRLKYVEDTQFSASQTDIAEAIKYLVFSATTPTIEHIFELPWLIHEDRSSATLSQWSSRLPHIIPTTAEESGILFSSRNDMLSWASLSRELSDYLARQASLATSIRATNIILLTPEHVIGHLQGKFRGFSSSEAEVAADSTVIDWLVCFWKWVMGWKESAAFLNRYRALDNLHLLPTQHQTIRKMSSQIIVFKHVNNAAVVAWAQLGIHPLHSELSQNDPLLQRLVKDCFVITPQIRSYIGFLTNNFVIANLIGLRAEDHVDIHHSLYEAQLAIKSTLSLSERAIFSRLPIFHIRQDDGRCSILTSVFGDRRRICVEVDADVPLPLLPGRQPIYVDMSKPGTKKLINMVESAVVHNELGLLQLAIDNWTVQSSDLKEKFVKRIFDNLQRISRPQLKSLPFVTVDNSDQLVAPCDLIDPSSPLSQLYTNEQGKFPAGKFATGDYLSMMRGYDFLKSQLDQSIVSERIEYLSNGSSSSLTFEKAKRFFQMLDDKWENAYDPIVVKSRIVTWLPSNPSKPLVSPANSRDRHKGSNQHPHLYDLVLDVLNLAPLKTPGFRRALGWSDGVSTDTLLRQFSSALTILPMKARIITLIAHFGQLYAERLISATFLDDLRKIVQDVAWVPVNSSRDPDAMSLTKYALLFETNLRAPFRQVYWRDASNKSTIDFLCAMGCTSRPPLNVLYEELHRLLHSPVPSISTSIIVLEEITQYADYDRAAVLVPSDDGHIYTLESVYYSDTQTSSLLNKFPLHRQISMSLAEQLKVPFLSAELLEQSVDEDEDQEQMAVDLRDRIEGFLRENDVLYAVNEFFANADDAKAKKFSILLDNRQNNFGTRVISPAFEPLQNNSWITFYNDAVLSNLDFSGLMKVGRGGKTDEIDTHGRHGLGALALYYFTDTPFIISGEYVMILDPTSSYLPNSARSGLKRTSLKIKISSLVRQYPDQLKRFENLFGFSSSSSTYNGTIFCLPLKATIPRDPCDSFECRRLVQGSYKELAQNAFFFTTHLEEISAKEYTPSNRPVDFWSMSSTRSRQYPLGDQYTRHNVSVNIQVRETAPISQKWIVCTCRTVIPIEHASTAADLKLPPKSNMTVQIAIDPLKGVANEESKSYLFSTLRLPKSNLLPFHLHARFAISSNRQSLIFTPVEDTDDPKTAFNAWILGDLVPSLYLTSLEYLKHHSSHEDRKRYDARVWWFNPMEPNDDITIFVRQAMFNFLPSSQIRLFQSANDEWISFREAVFSCDEPLIVRDVLTRLRLPQLVIAPPHTRLNKVSSAILVDPKYVKEAFSERISELQTTLTGKVSDIFDILYYIKDQAPLCGLPLFILADRSLTSLPGISERPVYHSKTRSHCDLFPSTTFLHNSCSQEIIQALIRDTSVNLHVFKDSSVPSLVETELERFDDVRAREVWIDRFWNEYNGLPGPPPLYLLENRDLKLLKGTSSHLSLPDCQPDTVVQDPGNDKLWLVPILKKLGINVLKSHNHPKVVNYLSPRFPSLFMNVIKCFMNKNVLSFSALDEDEHRRLASCLRSALLYSWPTSRKSRNRFFLEKQFVLRLPIWEAQLDGRQQLHSTSDLHVLPAGLAIEDISHYLRPSIAVASHSYFLNYPNLSGFFKPMSPSHILNVVQLPTVLYDSHDRRRYRQFLTAMIGLDDIYTVNEALKFPDCDGTLRVISDLYDHNVRLFSEDLKYTERSSFLHPDFRDLSIIKLGGLGFQQTITFVTFRKCAKIVEALGCDPSLQSDPVRRNDLMEMAKVTFDCYKTTLPVLLMTDARCWNRLDDIAFVRPRTDRRQAASYYVDPSYCSQISELLAPSQIIQPEFESIAWTQCALPLESLSDEVIAVNRTLGVPTASVVVEHLKVLATKIALRHPGDKTLLSDLKATYSWLNRHAEDAREVLVCAVDTPLFLNVVDPLTKKWNFQPASNLVLNLPEDNGRLKAVKPFLLEYEQLLLSSGCHKLHPLKPSKQPCTYSVDLLKGFSEMRRKGRLTDLFFEPTIQTDDDESSESQDLAAHKVFLAATLPYFQDKFEVENRPLSQDLLEFFSTSTEWDRLADGPGMGLKKFLETNVPDEFQFRSQKFKFEGTHLEAKAVLDFVYTGDFEYAAPLDNEEMKSLLDFFLALLYIAEEWDLPSLKAKITAEIVQNNLISCLLEEFPNVMKYAKLYHAEELETYLKDFNEQNIELLVSLIPKSNEE